MLAWHRGAPTYRRHIVIPQRWNSRQVGWGPIPPGALTQAAPGRLYFCFSRANSAELARSGSRIPDKSSRVCMSSTTPFGCLAPDASKTRSAAAFMARNAEADRAPSRRSRLSSCAVKSGVLPNSGCWRGSHLHRVGELPVWRSVIASGNIISAPASTHRHALDRRLQSSTASASVRAMMTKAGSVFASDADFAVHHLLLGNQLLVRPVAAALRTDLILDVHAGGAELDQGLHRARRWRCAEASVHVHQERQGTHVRDTPRQSASSSVLIPDPAVPATRPQRRRLR